MASTRSPPSSWALWRNPEDLSDHQRGQIADIARTNCRLYRASSKSNSAMSAAG